MKWCLPLHILYFTKICFLSVSIYNVTKCLAEKSPTKLLGFRGIRSYPKVFWSFRLSKRLLGSSAVRFFFNFSSFLHFNEFWVLRFLICTIGTTMFSWNGKLKSNMWNNLKCLHKLKSSPLVALVKTSSECVQLVWHPFKY